MTSMMTKVFSIPWILGFLLLSSMLPTINTYSSVDAKTTFNDISEKEIGFDQSNLPRNFTAIEGREAKLVCAVRNVGNKTVSWIQRDNLTIISVGRYTYTSDQRFQAIYGGQNQSDSEESTFKTITERWILRIRPVRVKDEGWYGCQISTRPVRSRYAYLKVVVPRAMIQGPSELYVDVGSTINITCVVKNAPGSPGSVQWRWKDKPIDYTSTRGGVSVLTSTSASTISSLILYHARIEDGGKYSCHAGEFVTPASIHVHVIHGDNYKLLQSNHATRLVYPLSTLALALIIITVLGTLRFTSPTCARICSCSSQNDNGEESPAPSVSSPRSLSSSSATLLYQKKVMRRSSNFSAARKKSPQLRKKEKERDDFKKKPKEEFIC